MRDLSGVPVLGPSQTQPAYSIRCFKGGGKGYDPEFSPGSEGRPGHGCSTVDSAKTQLR